MYRSADLESEIARTKTAIQDEHGAPDKDGLVAGVIADLENDAEFRRWAAHFTVLKHVEAYFRKFKEREERANDGQPVLEGFKHVQSEYLVPRNGSQRFIRVHDMTDEEFDEKAQQHRAMGQGHFDHADELIRFKEDRQAGPA